MQAAGHPCLYDEFPLSIVILRITIMALFVFTGAIVMYELNLWAMIGYLAFYSISAVSILALICRNCGYYGKRCDMALGLLAGLLMKQGPGKKALEANAPKTYPLLFLMLLAPSVSGLFLLIYDFNLKSAIWLGANILFLLLYLVTTRYLACPHCKNQVGCPYCLAPKSRRVLVIE